VDRRVRNSRLGGSSYLRVVRGASLITLLLLLLLLLLRRWRLEG
jgi:hypothetical protein